MPVGLYPGANSATGNGVTTSFAYSYRILSQADLVVTVAGVLKVLTTDYTVTGVGDAGGGNVVFVTAPANGAAIVIERKRAYRRDTDYQRNGSFDEETVDADFDGLVMLIQQVEAITRRAAKAPVEVTADQVITSADWAARASKFYGFNAASVFGLYALAATGTLTVSAFVETLLDDANGEAFLDTLLAALAAEAAPDIADRLILNDISAGTWDYIELANLFKAINGLTAKTKPVRTADYVSAYSAADAAARKVLLDDLPFPRSHLAGLGLSNNAVDPTNDIDIAAGSCRSKDNADNILLASALTKQLDAVWAVGTNAGMRASGAAIANTTYHIFAIKRPDTGVVDIAADTSATGANIAANTNAAYTEVRRIGSILREAGSIVAFSQVGDEFLRVNMVQDVSTTTIPSANRTLLSLSVPAGIKVVAKIAASHAGQATGGGGILFTSPDQTDTVAGAIGGQAHLLSTNSTGDYDGGEFMVRTNTSGQIGARSAIINGTLYCSTLGWIDRRGRDD